MEILDGAHAEALGGATSLTGSHPDFQSNGAKGIMGNLSTDSTSRASALNHWQSLFKVKT